MGLISALSIANTGLRTVQTGLNTVATNVAQSEVEGYKRQELSPNEIGITGGVRANVVRAADRFVEHQVRIETARSAEASVNDQYLSRVDVLFGSPGEVGSLDGLLNGFNDALQQLSTSPEDYVTRQQTVGAAQQLAGGLNILSQEVQALRQLAEDSIATTVSDINDALDNLQKINVRAAGITTENPAHSELMNERDRQLARLSDAMEIQVTEKENGAVTIFTKSGNTLLDGTAVQFDFDHHGNLNAGTHYDSDSAERDVGTVVLHAANGYTLDLINNGILDTGRIGALINMRDNVLVETQAQLDELAAGLATSLSASEIEGQAVTNGAQSGFEVDLSGLQKGNTISLAYVEGGSARNVTLVRVDDPSMLPLSNDHTAIAGDQVIGIDFSSGFAAAAGQINGLLGPGVDAVATVDGLRFYDDGAAGTSDITSATSLQTPPGLQDGSLGLALFVDGQGSQKVYSGTMEGIDQKSGFAGRISVNGAIEDDNELLVKYDNSSDIGIGDASRPLALIDRLNSSNMAFSSKAGIGSQNTPYSGSVSDYARLVIGDQTSKAANAEQVKQSQDVILGALNEQLESKTGVDIDQELTKLIALQNAYAANARVLSTVNDMLQQLMQM